MHDAVREDPIGRRVLTDRLPGRVPSINVSVPAQLRFLGIVGRSVDVALDGSRADESCARDLRLAVDELAAILILSAGTASDLKVTIAHDATNVHVRMEVSLAAAGFRPRTASLTRLLLDTTADAYEVRGEGSELIALVMRRLEST
jgi:anti-sigma regulatory factor (Ser/Thr protein kinase)